MPARVIVVPKTLGEFHPCAIWRPNSGSPYRCVLNITRVVESWDPIRGIWSPELRLCHLHAIEYVTGQPVMVPTIAQQHLDMLLLGA